MWYSQKKSINEIKIKKQSKEKMFADEHKKKVNALLSPQTKGFTFLHKKSFHNDNKSTNSYRSGPL